MIVPKGPLSEAGAVFFREPKPHIPAEAWAKPNTPKLIATRIPLMVSFGTVFSVNKNKRLRIPKFCLASFSHAGWASAFRDGQTTD
jgi:hypothetical protein